MLLFLDPPAGRGTQGGDHALAVERVGGRHDRPGGVEHLHHRAFAGGRAQQRAQVGAAPERGRDLGGPVVGRGVDVVEQNAARRREQHHAGQQRGERHHDGGGEGRPQAYAEAGTSHQPRPLAVIFMWTEHGGPISPDANTSRSFTSGGKNR